MNAAVPFLLFFSSLVCASYEGLSAVLLCALFCLLLSFWVIFLRGEKPPKVFRVFAAVAFFLRVYPLWTASQTELGTVGAPVFFALAVVVTVLISADKKGKEGSGMLANTAIPTALLALLPALFCVCGRFVLPDSLAPVSAVGLLTAVFCPLSAVLTFSDMAVKWYLPPLCALAATAAVLPLVLFDFLLWEGIAAVVLSPVCAAAELRILCGKRA